MPDFVALADLLTDLFQLAIYGSAEDYPAILGRTDKVGYISTETL
jgi:hypothetical protein